ETVAEPELRTGHIERRAGAEVRLLTGAALVPAPVAGVAERDDQRRRPAWGERRVGALSGPRAVESEVEGRDGAGRALRDAAEVRVPVPAVGRPARVGAADADGPVRRVGQDRKVCRAVDPALQDLRGARVARGEILA